VLADWGTAMFTAWGLSSAVLISVFTDNNTRIRVYSQKEITQ
jgi:hypothetical protein